jgi:hypothetical protein
LVRGAQAAFPETRFLAVRFGNVLGSNGSVVPIFERQLREGRPLTVTHPEVTRYFMTIAEAVQLVLQASLLTEARGRVAMLDMGKPVKILDLAKKMIRLSGVDAASARVVYTGLQPGEKLHEELAAPDEATEETTIPKVRLVGGAAGAPEAENGAGQGPWSAVLEALTGGLDPKAQDGSTLPEAVWGLLDLLEGRTRAEAPTTTARSQARPMPLLEKAAS